MIDEYESLDIGTSVEKELSDIRTAESYLRGFSKCPADFETSLMPEDAKWVKGVRKLYDRLPDSGKRLIDSYSDKNLSETYKREREKRLKHLALLLLTETGKESIFTILLPYGVNNHGKEEDGTAE